MINFIAKGFQEIGAISFSMLIHRTPAKLKGKIGELNAGLVYFNTVRKCSGYRTIVKEHLGYVPKSISVKKFHSLPVLDKNNYVRRFDIEEICAKPLWQGYTFQRSSGFSGNPTYWPQQKLETRKFYTVFRWMCDKYFNPSRAPMLFIIGFSLGTWAGGTDLFRLTSEYSLYSGRPAVTIAPGENVAESLEILRLFGGFFSRIHIIGNPLYIKRIVDLGKDLAWDKLKVSFATGGESTTEPWREWIAKGIGVDIEKEPMRIHNTYGTTDFGLGTATETSLSIAIKRLAINRPSLAQAIFDRRRNLPNLYQYNPLNHYLEQHGEEVLVTSWSHLPLIRYNVHDRSKVISYQKLKNILADFKVNIKELGLQYGYCPELPFIFVDSRTDGTVSIGGANVYPSNIEVALLENSELGRIVEHFYLRIKEDDQSNYYLNVELIIANIKEMAQNQKDSLIARAEELFLEVLLRDNSEYNVTWRNNPDVSPKVTLAGQESMGKPSIKRNFIKSGDNS